MNAGITASMLNAEAQHCRRQWALHWHARRHPDPVTRQVGREERRFWAAQAVRTKQMLITQRKLQERACEQAAERVS